MLAQHGGRFTPERAWLYRTAPALQDWAEWITARLDARDDTVPAWQGTVAKAWSRSVIGRLGMQHAVWELVGRAPAVGMKWWTERDLDTGQTGDLVHVGRQLWESTSVVDWALSMPAIPGWVASMCRVMLTQILLDLGPRKALYADTDSLLVEDRHAGDVQRIAESHGEWGLRLKRVWRGVTIRGPRQIITGDRVRISGVPVRAQLVADGTLVGEVRESLRGAIRHDRVGQVRSTPRRWAIRGVDSRRIVGEDGWTEPIRLGG